MPEDKIVEAHGSFREGYCTGCHQRYSLAWLKREIFAPDSNEGVPKCHTCKGIGKLRIKTHLGRPQGF